MIFDFLKNGKLNKKVLIAENYKLLGLNENQYAIVSLVLEFDKIDRRISSPNQLAEFMTLKVEEIESELDNLIKKNLLKIDVTNKKRNLDFSPLYNKITTIFQINLVTELTNTNPSEFVEHFFSVKLNNAQQNDLKEFMNSKNASTILLDALIKNNFNTVGELFKYLNSISAEEEIEITDYDWLRN